MMQKES